MCSNFLPELDNKSWGEEHVNHFLTTRKQHGIFYCFNDSYYILQFLYYFHEKSLLSKKKRGKSFKTSCSVNIFTELSNFYNPVFYVKLLYRTNSCSNKTFDFGHIINGTAKKV